MNKLALNMAHTKPFPLVSKVTYFDNSIELYVMLVGSLCLSGHDLIDYNPLNVIKVEIYRYQVLCDL